LDEAGERRAAFRAEEDYLLEQQTTLHNTIADLDEAWNMPLGSEAEELAKLQANNAAAEAMRAELSNHTVAKELYAEEIIEAGYPQHMLDKIGAMEAEIAAKSAEVAEIEHKSEIIVLANKLQMNRDLYTLELSEE
jgi:hypothetical protein